jgi:hypothetical protein
MKLLLLFSLLFLGAPVAYPLIAQSPTELPVEYQSTDISVGIDDLGGFKPASMDYNGDPCLVFRVAQTLVIRNTKDNISYFVAPEDIPDSDYNLANYRVVGFFNIVGDDTDELVLAPKFNQDGNLYVCSLNPDNHFIPSYYWTPPTPDGSVYVYCDNMDADPQDEAVFHTITWTLMDGGKATITVLGMGYTPGFNSPPTSNGQGEVCSLGNFEIQDLFLPNFRWPENRTIIPAGSQDFDGDQVNDYLIITLENCIIKSGDSHEVLYQQDGIPYESLSLNFTKMAFLDVCGTGTKSIMLCGSNVGQNLRDMEIILLIDTSTGEIVWALQPYLDNGFRVVGITKCVPCGDGSLRFIMSHQITGRVIIVGPGDEFNGGGGEEWSSPSKERNESYSLNLVWESSIAANTYMPLKLDFAVEDLDLNQDGSPDLASLVMQDSLSNTSVGIIVMDGATAQPIWDTPIPSGGFNDPAPYFHGFFDANGDGEKELFWGAETVQTADGTIHKPFNAGFAMEYIYDLNGDGFQEVIGKNADGKIQVYSSSELSASFEAQVKALGKLAVSPNPTAGTVNIAWNQPESGELHFELFDERGTLVMTSNLGQVGAGEAMIPVRLSESLPNGLYMARIVTNTGSSPAFIVLQR